METWELVQKTLSHIETHLSEELKIKELANIACLSPFYYQRIFSRLVGKPVMEYVKLRRLAKAASMLENTDQKMIDIGFNVGFGHHETFTRSFKDVYTITPEMYRKHPRPLSHFNKPDLSLKYRLVDEKVPLIADGVVLEVYRKYLEKSRFFAGLSIETPFSNHPSIDHLAELWHDFHLKKKKVDVFKKEEIGVGRPGHREGYLNYFVGAEVDHLEGLKDFSEFILFEGNYIVCYFEAEDFYQLTRDALDKAVHYMYGTWLQKNQVIVEPFMVEIYCENEPETSSMELWFKQQKDE
ncbi:AraC family transcriptional regulator [Bacillus sp. WMMC1349]|uniref:AraC family transcriptional regulator n=1 Tax=Bacillus sp. WMMC1349 TaxID=2736254 RepID=UPI0015537F2A|nr:AraC family transcriptional regulator [Bacillus sp. WMMC1349]NPC92884.1 AraC family transcriptional regulator [Bacillus sp. WMMC1349]